MSYRLNNQNFIQFVLVQETSRKETPSWINSLLFWVLLNFYRKICTHIFTQSNSIYTHSDDLRSFIEFFPTNGTKIPSNYRPIKSENLCNYRICNTDSIILVEILSRHNRFLLLHYYRRNLYNKSIQKITYE